MGVALLAGAWLARTGRYRAHAWCQSVVVLLNLVAVIVVMVPSFRTHVLPRIPARLNRSYYFLGTAHAILGMIAELLAIYVLLAVGTKLLPESLRLRRYKLWMRSALALWWLVLLLGAATYARWYIG